MLDRIPAILILCGVALVPASAETYKNTYPMPCAQLWPSVKTVLSNATEYNVKKRDDAKMTADFQPKHTVHFDISGVLLQRENHVRLVTLGTGCEMQVVSNYSGWGHDDQSDFKKRVDGLLPKAGGAAPPQPPTGLTAQTNDQPTKPENPPQ